MSSRRNRNTIRGPQSALTDFLAANNISAAQIREDYENRRRQSVRTNQAATADPTTLETETADGDNGEEDDDDGLEEQAQTASSKKRKRLTTETEEKVGKPKKAKGGKKSKNDKNDSSDFEDDEDDEFVRDMYKKARPAPGQLAHCEVCSKRFTVTPYSRDGPGGGLLCTPCGKQLKNEQKKENKPAARPAGRKRRKAESDKLDGLVSRGAKSLQQICIEKVVQHHEEVDELGDIPQSLLQRLSAIFSKRRVLKPDTTLPLFLRPDLDEVVLHDAAYLEVKDYKQIFAVVPTIRKLALGNACQFKDEVIQYMAERCHQLEDLCLYAANLVTNKAWAMYFEKAGRQLRSVKLKWMDATFDDENVADLIYHCKSLDRLKLKFCRNIGETSLATVSKAPALRHLSLHMTQTVSAKALEDMIDSLGPNLQTLSLEKFLDADDSVLQAVHSSCQKLSKFRLSENDLATDVGFADLFTDWVNPPLRYIDVNCTRDMDNSNPDGPEETIGMGGIGFRAMMAHSGKSLEHLNVACCRHIELKAFLDVFNGSEEYSNLRHLDVSFCHHVNTAVIAGIFKTCPSLKKLVAFGCFDVGDVVVPRDIVLIGIPKAQDAVEQFGVGIEIDEALSRMVEVGG